MKIISMIFIISVSLLANTTICYKKNYSDITNIESQNFKGGKCRGDESIESMKIKGWLVEDIKIKNLDNGNYDFVYILKKTTKKQVENKINSNIDYAKLAQKTDEYKQEKQKKSDYELAVKKYQIHCISCHGKKGEIEAYGTSKKLYILSKDEFIENMDDYRWDNGLNKGKAYLMQPSAKFTTKEIDGYIYDYLMKQQNK